MTPPYAAVAAPEGAVEDTAAAELRLAPIWRAAFLKFVKELAAPVFRRIGQRFTIDIKPNILPSAPQFTANTIPAPQ